MCSRCAWAKTPLLTPYHDREWGVPTHDDRALFELLSLEGAQAGLSWEIVLRKRDAYRTAFAGFDPAVVAAFDEARVDRLATDPGIVRHRGKIASVVINARAFLALQREHGSFDAWLWRFVDNVPRRTNRVPSEPPATVSPLSERVSKALRQAGFGFVGPTIIQAYLQAAGLLDDHDHGCFRRLDPPQINDRAAPGSWPDSVPVAGSRRL